jgi:YbbR domain-containing protein
VRGLFVHNFLLKLLSLAIAVGLWFFVNAAERDSEAEYPIPVRLINQPTSLLLVSPRIETVDLRVSGPPTLLDRIERADLTIDIDLARVRPGTTTFRLRPNSLALPRGVVPIRMTPSEITFEFAKVESKRVPVHLAVGGRPGDLLITESKVTPEQVEISGPARVVRDIEVVKTEPLDLSDAAPGRIKRELSLALEGEFLTASSPTVHVDLLLEEPQEEGKTGPIAIVVRNALGEATVTPPEVTLRVKGPRSRVKALELPNGAVYVDAQGLEPGTHRLMPLATLPAGIELARELKEVRVKISEIAATMTPTAGATPAAVTTPSTPQAGAGVSEELLYTPENGDVG